MRATLEPRLCECGCGETTALAQRTSTTFGHVRGMPLRFVNGHQRRNPLPQWTTEDRGYATPCRIWGHGKVRGYGVVKVDGVTRYSHVVEWEAVHGSVPDGHELDHLCRQPLCGEPSHLDPVTHAINCQRGATAKLTAEEAIDIHESSDSTAALAARFGVSRRTITNIRNGDRWATVTRAVS